jgi:hypothetical protein
MYKLFPTVLVFAVSWSLAHVASAQTGAALLLQPWPTYGPEDDLTHVRLQTFDDVLYVPRADVKGTDDDASLWFFDSRGRFKFTREPGPGPAIGYDILYVDVRSGDASLPNRLFDGSLATAFGTRLDDDWELGVVVGFGYAGVRPFADGDSLYAMGDVILARALDERSKITFNLNYNGNRNIWPDIPLPAVSYARRSQIEGLTYIVGFPFTTITYSPDVHWKFNFTYSVPYFVEARVDYSITRKLGLFAAYDSFTRGFWLEDVDNRRVFFSQRRIEAGVQYGIFEQLNLVLAGGYAFDQEFETGWDIRNTTTLRDLDSRPYVRFAITSTW